MKLGTYTTFDAPTKQINQAYKWLVKQFDVIEGNVRQLGNNHEFGEYLSFEIDYPYHLEDSLTESQELDEWHDKADKIQEAYNKKFAEYL